MQTIQWITRPMRVLRFLLALFVSSMSQSSVAATVVEYYHAGLDNYFITGDPVEQRFVDSGGAGAWKRTGNTFETGGPSQVCRFYGGPLGPNSHFYTVDAGECDYLKSIYTPTTKSWKFESYDFSITPAAGGACPANYLPVYRAYNNGSARGVDSNHRITSNPAAVSGVVARGWKSEGVVMCTSAMFASNTYSLPTDSTKVTYPESYAVPTIDPTDISTDPCNLDLRVVTYPQSWLGNRELPKIDGAPLNATIKGGIFLKDIMLHENPAFVHGCKGNLLSEFAKTIKRLKDLGLDYVSVPQWHWASKYPDGTWTITRAEDTFGALSDADLAFFVETAHAAGLKVMITNQIQGMVDTPTSPVYIPEPNIENFTKWFAAFRSFMVERSKFFQGIGIDVWELGCSACMYHDDGDRSAAAIDLFRQQYTTILADVKSDYSGKLMTTQTSWLSSAQDFLKGIDIIQVAVWTLPWSQAQSDGLTVQSYKSAVQSSIGNITNVTNVQKLGKTVMVGFGIQSRSNALTLPGYMEETGCTTSMGALNISASGCIQRETQTDFALQATVYEATLELLGQLDPAGGLIVFPGDYWVTDSLMPETAFPNIGNSIRNKPAEGILKTWLTRQ